MTTDTYLLPDCGIVKSKSYWEKAYDWAEENNKVNDMFSGLSKSEMLESLTMVERDEDGYWVPVEERNQ